MILIYMVQIIMWVPNEKDVIYIWFQSTMYRDVQVKRHWEDELQFLHAVSSQVSYYTLSETTIYVPLPPG